MFPEMSSKKLEKYTCSGGRLRVPKILVGPVGVFLTYGDGLYSHIVHFCFGQIYLINYLIPYSSPWAGALSPHCYPLVGGCM